MASFLLSLPFLVISNVSSESQIEVEKVMPAKVSPRKRKPHLGSETAALSVGSISPPKATSVAKNQPRYRQTRLKYSPKPASLASTDSALTLSPVSDLQDDEDTNPMTSIFGDSEDLIPKLDLTACWSKHQTHQKPSSQCSSENLDLSNQIKAEATSQKAVTTKKESKTKAKPSKKDTVTVEALPLKNEDESDNVKTKSGRGMKQLTLTSSGRLSDVFPTEPLEQPKVIQKPVPSKKVPASKSKKATEVVTNGIDSHFPIVRRSERRCAKEMKKFCEENTNSCILNNVHKGLKVVETEDRGRGVIATQIFFKDQFVVEYSGDFLDEAEARQREAEYQKDDKIGCYMYYFMHGSRRYCIDATAESGKLGRLLNHSRSNPNCYTKVVPIDGHPYLVLFAKRDIDVGEELVYDYGERDKSVLVHHPWLKW